MVVENWQPMARVLCFDYWDCWSSPFPLWSHCAIERVSPGEPRCPNHWCKVSIVEDEIHVPPDEWSDMPCDFSDYYRVQFSNVAVEKCPKITSLIMWLISGPHGWVLVAIGMVIVSKVIPMWWGGSRNFLSLVSLSLVSLSLVSLSGIAARIANMRS